MPSLVDGVPDIPSFVNFKIKPVVVPVEEVHIDMVVDRYNDILISFVYHYILGFNWQFPLLDLFEQVILNLKFIVAVGDLDLPVHLIGNHLMPVIHGYELIPAVNKNRDDNQPYDGTALHQVPIYESGAIITIITLPLIDGLSQ